MYHSQPKAYVPGKDRYFQDLELEVGFAESGHYWCITVKKSLSSPTGWRIPQARTGASPEEELHAGPAAPSPLQAKNSIISCHCQFATSQHNHSFAGREGSDRSDQPTDPPITMLGPAVAPR
ncbi:predicted protein [Histoplasma capsulatum G186AR]|uniref:Uncharacterized protein n=1 Tax=Ajellomyces capsulatus (strain G186AR / H82 / ATCC MYA-2454 / RMSCC 2432) TaxID=447093 RepID=C0NXE5_AJECG|nr:uncharacterized protein HCBG_08137 [Histoplasma capsulatum G186AR]EEH04011.1 predicted protein [Histoplasma capsulatum G186AR]